MPLAGMRGHTATTSFCCTKVRSVRSDRLCQSTDARRGSAGVGGMYTTPTTCIPQHAHPWGGGLLVL